jgi:endonuclease/exonuclease/phosphatase family metal-dependent hydrolase
MHRILCVFCVLIFLPFLAKTQHADAGIRVMTFNIRYDNPNDGAFGWNKRKSLVHELLDDEKPGIIGFQEVLKNQYLDLATMLPDYASFGRGRDDGNTAGEYAPVFYQKEQFSVLDSGVFWLSEQPHKPGSRSWGAACTRIVTWVKLVVKASGDSLFVFNTHFDHISEQARIHAAVMLDSAITQMTNNLPVILTGDFNATTKESAFNHLNQRFELAAPDQESFNGNETTFVGFPADRSRNNIIDYIFYTPASRFIAQTALIIEYNENGRYPSDHLPVVAVFTIKTNPHAYSPEK